MKLRRIFSGIAAAAIAAGYTLAPAGLPAPVGASFAAYAESAGENIVYGDYIYNISGGGATIVKYRGKDKNVVIPDKLGGYPVTEIGAEAFYGLPVKRVTLPKTVKKIGYMAFCVCYWLEEITLPDSIESVSFKAFSGCVGLKELNISAGAEGIEDGAFFMCSGIEKINVSKNSRNYKVKNGVLYTYDGKRLMICPPSLRLTSFKVPKGVEALDACAFFACKKLKKITLPSGLRYISGNTFNNCTSLKEVTIPAGTETIATNAFEGCTSLKKITIPASVKSFSNYIFDRCPNVTIYGAEGSEAQKYAARNDIPFKEVSGAAAKPSQDTEAKPSKDTEAKPSRDGAGAVEEKMPIYSSFIKQTSGTPMYVSMTLTTTSEYAKDGIVYNYEAALSGDNKLYVNIGMGESGSIVLIASDKGAYYLEPANKTAMFTEDIYFTETEGQNLFNSIHPDLSVIGGELKFKSGKKSYNGKTYLYESVTGDNGSITVLADSGKNVKFIIQSSAYAEVTCEIKKISKNPDKSLFELPSDYRLISKEEFAGARYGIN